MGDIDKIIGGKQAYNLFDIIYTIDVSFWEWKIVLENKGFFTISDSMQLYYIIDKNSSIKAGAEKDSEKVAYIKLSK